MTREQLAALVATVTEGSDFTPYHHGKGPTSRRKTSGERLCPNCDTLHTPVNRRRLYCDNLCRQAASAVRYARKAIATHGQPLPADQDDAVGIKIAHVVAGGYAEQTRRLAPAIRAAVITRDHARCTRCGKSGEEIDHIDGDSPDLANLRYLCRRCHRQVTQQHLRRIPDGHPALFIHAALLARIYAATPLRPCDADDWKQTCRRLSALSRDGEVQDDSDYKVAKLSGLPPGCL